MKKTLAFEWGNEKRVKISDPGHSDSLFYEGYRQALAGVVEIMLASSAYSDSGEGCIDPIGEDISDYNYPNNIIVFSGERGAGKSSAMLTFVEGLKNRKSGLYHEDFLDDMIKCELPNRVVLGSSIKNMLRNAEFVSLSPVDPTTLEKDGQILPMILSRMLRKFKETWEKNVQSNSGHSLNTKNALLRRFESCYQHICAIKKIGSQNKDYEKLDAIMELGDSSRLKHDLAELVQELLKFCTEKTSSQFNSTHLVLMIDDTDVNIDQAYSILEDIRKYLLIPHLIIVMASDLNHLVQVVKNNFLKSYDKEVQGRMNTVEDMTYKYIAKLFPQTRQIILPDLSTYFREHIKNISLCYKVPNSKRDNNEKAEETILPDGKEGITDLQEQIFRLIYRKTGLIFLPHERKLHFIIPDNMRLLGHFLSMLVQMKEICDPDVDNSNFFPVEGVELEKHVALLKSRLQNLQRFREYFLNTWIPNNLEYDYAIIIKELDMIDVPRKVNYVCETMRSLQPEAVEYEPSYANMLELLMAWEDLSESIGRKKLVFAINTYFSLLGHCITVETLISFCSKPGAKSLKSGCAFVRLHDLYGSQVFPYLLVNDAIHKKETGEEDRLVKNNYLCAKTRTEDFSKVRWPMPPVTYETDEATTVFASYASFLHSVFFDFSDKLKNEHHYADLCTALVNVLYINQETHKSSFAKEVFPGEFRSSIRDVSWRQWYVIQRQSLSLILNWDVQQVVIETMKAMIFSPHNVEGDANSDSFTTTKQMGEFYDELTKAITIRAPGVIGEIDNQNLALLTHVFIEIMTIASKEAGSPLLRKWINSVISLSGEDQTPIKRNMLKEQREKTRLTQKELAKKVGVSSSTIAKYEKMEIIPQNGIARKIEAFLSTILQQD